MQKRNYGQAKRQKEIARKARQQLKQDRRKPKDPKDDAAATDLPVEAAASAE